MDLQPKSRVTSWETNSSGDYSTCRRDLEPPEYPRSLQKKLLGFEQALDSNPTNAFSILLEWATILSSYSKKRLRKLTSYDVDYRFKNNNSSLQVQSHLKEALFTACTKFQEAEALTQFRNDQNATELSKLYFGWGDSLFLISLYFKLPFFELANEKYEMILEKIPKYLKQYKILRKEGIVLAEQAYFSMITSTNFQIDSQNILRLFEEKFTKSLTLKPNSFKTHIQWARVMQRNCRISKTFAKVAELTNDIAFHYKTALRLKPQKTFCLELWGIHVDWVITFYTSCRRKEESQLTHMFTEFSNAFKAIAQNSYLPLQPLLAFAILEEPHQRIADLSLELLHTLRNKSRVKQVVEESAKHIAFLSTIQLSKKETKNTKLAKAKQIISQLPPALNQRWVKSGLTFAQVADHMDILINCLYFLHNDPHHPLFAQTHKRAKGTVREPQEDPKLSSYFRLEDPALLYTNQQLIGSGGFGKVYTATETKNGTLIAMKVFKSRVEGERPEIRVTKEIDALRACKNKYLVQFKEAFLWDNSITFIMEYCDGGTLRDICREVRLSEAEIGYFLQQITEGLRFIHDKNMVHRDLKADNILLSLNGSIRIADLGLCEKLTSNRDRLPMVGTSCWMAPEVICQQPYSFPADVWSLGCVAHELATGHAPYSEQGSALAAMFWVAVKGAPTEVKFPMTSTNMDKGILGWSSRFESFLDSCFHMNPLFRATTSELLALPLLLNSENLNIKLKKKMELVFVGRSLKSTCLC